MSIARLKELRSAVDSAITLAEMGGIPMSDAEREGYGIRFGSADVVIGDFAIKYIGRDMARSEKLPSVDDVIGLFCP